MARPTCVKCGGTTFEIANYTPTGSKYILSSVHCSSCGGVVGMLDGLNIGALLEQVIALTKRGIK